MLVMSDILELSVKSPCLWVCFHPHPLFQWYPQSKEILLILSMKCWNSAFNAQGSRVIFNNCAGTSNEKICSSSGDAQEKGKTGWNSVYQQNCWKKYPGVQLFRFVKFSFPVTGLMPYYRGTLAISTRVRRIIN